jgi:hypothetical protein
MKRAFILLALIATVCCVRTKSPFPRYDALHASEGSFPIKYEFVDIPSERRIEIRFNNTLDEAVCLDTDQWPGGGGVMQLGSQGMTLVIGSRRFRVDETTPEFCPGCAHFVAPGQRLRASIPYAAFHLPEPLINESKILEFVPKGFRCKKRS